MRSIDADALKDFINEVCFSKKLAKYRFDYGSRGQIECILTYIDNAPTVDLVSPTIKVNIPEEAKQKLIEELQKPHKLLVLPEPEVAFERPQGNWGKWVISEIQCPNCFEYFQTDCYSMGELNKCPNCEAKMINEEETS